MKISKYRRNTGKDLWQERFKKPKINTNKKTLSLDCNLRSVMEYTLELMGNNVSFSEASSHYFQKCPTELIVKGLNTENPYQHYDVVIASDSSNEQQKFKPINLETNLDKKLMLTMPESGEICLEQLSYLQKLNQKSGFYRRSFFYRLIDSDTKKTRLNFIKTGDFNDLIHVFNQDNEAIILNIDYELKNPHLMSFLTNFNYSNALTLIDLIKELQARSNLYDFGFTKFYLPGENNYFFNTYECNEDKLDDFAKIISKNIDNPIDMYSSLYKINYIVDGSQISCSEPYGNHDWVPNYKNITTREKYTVDDIYDEFEENFLYCTQLSYKDHIEFLDYIEMKAKDDGGCGIDIIPQIEKLKNIEFDTQSFDDECPRKNIKEFSSFKNILYIYSKKGENYIPIGFVSSNITRSYSYPMAEELERYHPDVITIFANIKYIYVEPKFRNKGVSQFIAEALSGGLAYPILSNINEHYREHFESPMPISFSFDADTVTYGGQSTLSKLSSSLAMLIESNNDMVDEDDEDFWNIHSASVDYS